ncbi:MAG: DoxX family membrane protein [Verrucomicrobiae bacterium]|nr:DoxX family membrane protein [Verrucomicrobiae bacterium]
MQNLAILLTLLLLPYWALIPAHAAEPVRGRVGIFLVFAFTGLGHFIKTQAMSQMLPPGTPMRVPLVYLSGLFELLAGIAVLIPSLTRPAGILLCVFLIAVLPLEHLCRHPARGFWRPWDGSDLSVVRIPVCSCSSSAGSIGLRSDHRIRCRWIAADGRFVSGPGPWSAKL